MADRITVAEGVGWPAARAARKDQKLSTRALAARSAVCASTITMAETGARAPSLETMYRIAEDGLGVPLAQLWPPARPARALAA